MDEEDNLDAPTEVESKTVDQETNWREVRQSLASLKQDNQQLRQELYEARRHSSAPARQEEDDEPTESEGLVTGKQLQSKTKKLETELQQIRAEMKGQLFLAKNSDFSELVNKYLPSMYQEDPELREIVENSPDPAKTAYKLIKQSARYQKDSAKPTINSPKADRILANAAKAPSPQAIAGGVKSSLSVEKQMTPEERWKQVQMNARRPRA